MLHKIKFTGVEETRSCRCLNNSLVDDKKPCGNLISYSLKPEWDRCC
ncbi:hypothetical protein Nmel_002126 [Mimus melanotis]